MARKEFHPAPPPTPTPEQLENSIKALKKFNPSDKRISKYDAQIDKAERRIGEWEEKTRRQKKALKILRQRSR